MWIKFFDGENGEDMLCGPFVNVTLEKAEYLVVNENGGVYARLLGGRWKVTNNHWSAPTYQSFTVLDKDLSRS